MSTHRVEAFSVSHAALLDGTTGAEAVDGDIFGVRSASLAADIGNFDNTGDDAVLSSWFWFNFATITVESGFIPFDLLSLLTGTPTKDYVDLAAYTAGTDVGPKPVRSSFPTGTTGDTSYATALATYTTAYTAAQASPGHIFEQELWPEQSMNTAPMPVLVRMPSKDSKGRIRLLDFVLYRVQFSPINFTGPSYKTGLTVNYSGRAVMSDVDETGNSLGTLPDGRAIRSVGRLINKPG